MLEGSTVWIDVEIVEAFQSKAGTRRAILMGRKSFSIATSPVLVRRRGVVVPAPIKTKTKVDGPRSRRDVPRQSSPLAALGV